MKTLIVLFFASIATLHAQVDTLKESVAAGDISLLLGLGEHGTTGMAIRVGYFDCGIKFARGYPGASTDFDYAIPHSNYHTDTIVTGPLYIHIGAWLNVTRDLSIGIQPAYIKEPIHYINVSNATGKSYKGGESSNVKLGIGLAANYYGIMRNLCVGVSYDTYSGVTFRIGYSFRSFNGRVLYPLPEK